MSARSALNTVVGLPALVPTMTAGTIASWCVEEGDEVGPGDVFCEIETDNATVDFDCMDDGFVAKILVPEGQEVPPSRRCWFCARRRRTLPRSLTSCRRRWQHLRRRRHQSPRRRRRQRGSAFSRACWHRLLSVGLVGDVLQCVMGSEL